MVSDKKLRFDTVEIRHYPFVLSDHPGTTYGPPIELGWEYYTNEGVSGNEYKMELNSYEKERKPRGRNRMYLSQAKRESMLREANYSEVDLQRAIWRKEKIRRQRKQNNVIMNPVTTFRWSIRYDRRVMKLGRAMKNLQSLKSDGMFHDHSAIYRGWWIPAIA